MGLSQDRVDFLNQINFEKGNGVVPVVVQDKSTKEVLMVAYGDKEAISKTLETNQMWYLSRERGLWHKGETSGNFQDLVTLTLDCDNDTVLAVVNQRGVACHRGTTSCFTDGITYSSGEDNE